MNGRDQRSVRRRDDVSGVVHDVNGSCRTLDHGVAEPLPGLVERPTWERELSHGNGRDERLLWGLAMPCGHADEVEVAPLVERPEQLHRRCRDPARDDVP